MDVQLRLHGQDKDRFLEIKRAKGLTDDTEVLRLLINEYFEKKLARGASPRNPSSHAFWGVEVVT